MNYYLTAIEGMQKLLNPDNEPLKHFKKQQYSVAFQQFYQDHLAVMDAIESLYNSVNDPAQMIANMAEALAEEASKKMNACKRRGEKDTCLMDMNMLMVVYILPMIKEFGGNSSAPLVEGLLAAWKKTFPKTNLQAASFEAIEKGFHKKFCYITTAVCEYFGKEDSCYELTLLRDYRDHYLASQEGGAELIDEYYDVAPSIVKHIGQQKNSEEIYHAIWSDYLSPCIEMIEGNQLEECKEKYVEMVYDLKERYFLH